jgi:glycosyltransferase involved in cell wall biosynthesis
MGRSGTVLFCSQTASAIGGVENWLDQLCIGLDSSRWRPIVALVRGSKAHDPDRFKAAHPKLETVEIDGRGLPEESRIRAVMRCVRQVDPTIFIPLVVADAHVAAARLRSMSSRVKYLLTLHGNTAPQLLDARELVPYADFAVAPGALTCRLLGHFGAPSERLRYIPNGAREPVLARRPRPVGSPIRLGYVGRLTRGDKRVRDIVPFVQALAATNEPFELVIAGDGPERASLAAALSSYPVRFMGGLTSEKLYSEVYPNLDVLLLFSESEAFGIVLLEALLHGVVPVTSAFVGCASEALVENDVTGLLFPVGDAEAASAGVVRLVREPQALARLSVAGQSRVAGRYSWSSCVQAWGEALDATLSMPARRVSATPPRPGRSGGGRLDRLGVPPGIVDAFRRARRGVFGVSPAMQGGEEWPWTPLRRDRSELEAMHQLSVSMDGSAWPPYA